MQIKELPTARNVNSLLQLTPGIGSNYRPTSGFGSPGVCVGGIGVFCNPGLNGFNVGDLGDNITVGGDQTNLQQGRVLVDGQVINTGGGGFLGGMTGGYTADIANAQEVNIRLSGALGSIGDRRLRDQHRPAHRRQPVHRRLQHDLHDREVVRDQLPELPEHHVGVQCR